MALFKALGKIRSTGIPFSDWVVAVLAIGFLLGGPGVGLSLMVWNHEVWQPLLASWTPQVTVLVLAMGGGIAVGVALLPSFFLGALCGYLLPAPLSYGSAVLGIICATWIGLTIGLILSKNFLERMLKLRPRWWEIRMSLGTIKSSTSGPMLASLRLAPQMPFALTNFLCAIWPGQIRTLFFWSVLGLLPRTLIAVWIGSAASKISELRADEMAIWQWVLSGFILVVLFKVLQNRVRNHLNDSTVRP